MSFNIEHLSCSYFFLARGALRAAEGVTGEQKQGHSIVKRSKKDSLTFY
jgi:hypothetical protein